MLDLGAYLRHHFRLLDLNRLRHTVSNGRILYRFRYKAKSWSKTPIFHTSLPFKLHNPLTGKSVHGSRSQETEAGGGTILVPSSRVDGDIINDGKVALERGRGEGVSRIAGMRLADALVYSLLQPISSSFITPEGSKISHKSHKMRTWTNVSCR